MNFDDWLRDQGLTPEEYDAMDEAEQQALHWDYGADGGTF